MAQDILNDPRIGKLLTVVEEATRSTQEGVKFFVEPAEDALRRATSHRHHIVFGRRGSGKTSLLRKAAADLTTDRRPIAWVDLESFKNHSYPDLLLSVLISTFREYAKWLGTAAIAPATKTTFWNTLFGKKPTRSAFDKKKCRALVTRFTSELQQLENLLHQPEHQSVETRQQSGATQSSAAEARVGTQSGPLAAGAQGTLSSQSTISTGRTTAYTEDKIDFLGRHILDYQQLFDDVAELSSGDVFLFFDDLYHIRRSDQARVVDYFHSIGKGHHLWLKIGTIRHRSEWYKHGNPPRGMKLGDDADEIDLDLTLEKYDTTKRFLTKVLSNLADSVQIEKLTEIMTNGAIDRLVLASGGVARDFLSIFRRSVVVARERGSGTHRGPRVSAEEINVAAGEYDTTKREEFKRDIYADEETSLDELFSTIRTFCLDSVGSNCFLIDKDAVGPMINGLHELVDLKLLHVIRSRVTVNTHRGKIFEAYMLDLSQYAGARKRRNLKLIEFWRSGDRDALRKSSLILSTS